MKVLNWSSFVCSIAALLLSLFIVVALVGCSPNGSQDQSAASVTSENAQTIEQAAGNVFSIDFPSEPEYIRSDDLGFLTETYISKTSDCYVLVGVDWAILDLEGKEPHVFAAELTYAFLKDRVNMTTAEDDIDMGTFDSHPAAYISLESQDSDSYIFCSTILGNDYALTLLIMADTNEKIHAIMDSFSVN